ncbi:MAG: amidohydrolase [Gammaproteobacteria bacterium]|nr:amidohydrolase [Gammaproteobacteria bacterium]
MRRLCLLSLALAAHTGLVVADADLAADVASDYSANLSPLFLHFHQHPELSGREEQTSARLAGELRALGLEVTEHVGGTGVVALLRNGNGPTVLIRADMDGLPVAERSGLAYASQAKQMDPYGVEQSVMHACGHDTHMTALVGTARQLIARKSDWHGTVVFIGQPAEETISGAKAMLEDGLYSRFPKPEYALAFHVNALDEAGKVSVPDGIAYSSSDSVNIKVRGIGAHGAAPHKGLDPVLIASSIVVNLQSIVARTIDPLQPGVVTVGSIHGGAKHNIIPEEVNLQLTVRADTPEVRDQLLAAIRRVALGTAKALGASDDMLPIVEPHGESTPPTRNDPATTQRVRAVIEKSLGASRMSSKPREGMGAEDFAYFVTPESGVKGVYFGVGGTPAADLATAASHHSPLFKVTPEPVIRSAVEAMTVAAIALMSD